MYPGRPESPAGATRVPSGTLEATEIAQLAAEMMAKCTTVGQSARRVDDDDAARLRQGLRAAAAAAGIHIRTAFTDGAVLVARTDAALWDDDPVTMRTKLTPPA